MRFTLSACPPEALRLLTRFQRLCHSPDFNFSFERHKLASSSCECLACACNKQQIIANTKLWCRFSMHVQNILTEEFFVEQTFFFSGSVVSQKWTWHFRSPNRKTLDPQLKISPPSTLSPNPKPYSLNL